MPQLRGNEPILGLNIPLDGYRAMLNIRPLGGEGIPFFSIVFVP